MATTKTTTTVKTVTTGDAVETQATPETPATQASGIAHTMGRLVGKAIRSHKQAKAARKPATVAVWTPDAANPEALRCDFLVSIGKRFAVIDTVGGLRSIPVSAIISTK